MAARAPKRERGRVRVEALLDAAAEVFLARGEEAATMTEIAACAGASIGSLYQFFPAKAALADALRERFAAHAEAEFDALAMQAGGMTAEALANALLTYMNHIKQDRAVMLALSDVRNEHDVHRMRTRARLSLSLGRVLRAAAPALPAARAKRCARLILYLLRLVPELPREPAGRALGGELHALLQGYLMELGVRGA